jgi:branched-chain amino acid transport system substrate-binding protein
MTNSSTVKVWPCGAGWPEKGGANVVFFDGSPPVRKISPPWWRAEEREYRFRLLRRLPPGNGPDPASGARGRSENPVYGPGRRSERLLSNIAGESAEGLLVTKPKNYDQVPANKPIVDAIKAKKQDPSGAFVWTTYAALQSLQAGLNQSDDPAEIAT